MNIREAIIKRILKRLNLLLWDPKVPGPNRNDEAYDTSMFAQIYPDAYSGGQRSDKYPLSLEEMVILEEGRLLKAVRIGFIPIAKLETLPEYPVLYITSATDFFATEIEEEGNNFNAEMYPINLRLLMKEPENATAETSNVIVASRIREALGYVLDFSFFHNMKAERRGYDTDSVVRRIRIADGQNLEDFATPYAGYDFRVEIVFVEQASLNANQSR